MRSLFATEGQGQGQRVAISNILRVELHAGEAGALRRENHKAADFKVEGGTVAFLVEFYIIVLSNYKITYLLLKWLKIQKTAKGRPDS